MNRIGPREDPRVSVEHACNLRRGWRAPIAIILTVGVIVALVALVTWR
jgi:hypothetical protein